MAGSYDHTVDDEGRLWAPEDMTIATETQGDAYETIEEMFGMIWYLANGDAARVEVARQHYEQGIALSPGRAPSSSE
jgi:predicted methyltransferase